MTAYTDISALNWSSKSRAKKAKVDQDQAEPARDEHQGPEPATATGDGGSDIVSRLVAGIGVAETIEELRSVGRQIKAAQLDDDTLADLRRMYAAREKQIGD